MPNFKLTIDVNIYAQEVVVLRADNQAQAEAALKAYLEADGPYLEGNVEHVDHEVIQSSVTETDELDDGGHARDWI